MGAISMPIPMDTSTPTTRSAPRAIGYRPSDSGTFPVVTARLRDLTDEQNERVRDLVRELLRREGNSQTSLAPRLGMRQPALSGFLARRQGTSYAMATRAARLAIVSVDDVLAGRSLSLDPYPARARALSVLADDAHPLAVAYVRSLCPARGDEVTALEWCRILSHWDAEARAGRL